MLIRREAEETVRCAEPERWAVTLDELERLVLAVAKMGKPQNIPAVRAAVAGWQQEFPESPTVAAWLMFVVERLG